MMKEDVEEDGNGERFLDIADAYMETDHCEEALPILRRCVDSQEYSQVSQTPGVVPVADASFLGNAVFDGACENGCSLNLKKG